MRCQFWTKSGLIAVLLLAGITSAALPAKAGDKEFYGTGLGAALGGLLGSQFGRGEGQLATTAAGVFLGGLVGNDVGTSLDRADRLSYGGYSRHYDYYQPRPSYSYYEQTYVAPPAPPPQRVIYAPQPVVQYRQVIDYEDYDNDAGHYRRGGDYCREYTQRVRIGDRIEESYGTACLQPDGAWQVRR
jgi:surface antigen